VREEVLGGTAVAARGTFDAGRATIEITAPRGTTRVTCGVSVAEDEGGKRVRGEAEVSIAALGGPPVKGPMGAFRVKDRVRVEFDLFFR
jgi:hypothetical protein